MTYSQQLRNKMLKTEMESLLRREQEMFDLYNEIVLRIDDNKIKEKLMSIMLQEEDHVRMSRDILSIMSVYLNQT